MLSNCGAGKDSWKSLGQQGDFYLSNTKGNQPLTFTGRTDAETDAPIYLATWCKELTHCIRKRPWCWEILKTGGEVGDRG